MQHRGIDIATRDAYPSIEHPSKTNPGIDPHPTVHNVAEERRFSGYG